MKHVRLDRARSPAVFDAVLEAADVTREPTEPIERLDVHRRGGMRATKLSDRGDRVLAVKSDDAERDPNFGQVAIELTRLLDCNTRAIGLARVHRSRGPC